MVLVLLVLPAFFALALLAALMLALAVLIIIRNHRVLQRYRYIAMFSAIVLLLLPAVSDLGIAGGRAGDLLRWVSTGAHFEQMMKGLVSTSDLAYFAVMIGSFLLLTKAAVESVRWR